MTQRLMDGNGVIDFIDDNGVTDFLDDVGNATFGSDSQSVFPLMLLMQLRIHACWLTFLMLSMSQTT